MSFLPTSQPVGPVHAIRSARTSPAVSTHDLASSATILRITHNYPRHSTPQETSLGRTDERWPLRHAVCSLKCLLRHSILIHGLEGLGLHHLIVFFVQGLRTHIEEGHGLDSRRIAERWPALTCLSAGGPRICLPAYQEEGRVVPLQELQEVCQFGLDLQP
jgi:hypothetical protein